MTEQSNRQIRICKKSVKSTEEREQQAMSSNTGRIQGVIFAGSYFYLALPVMIFCVGWCRWYIGLPVAVAVAVSVVLCLGEYKEIFFFRKRATECGSTEQARLCLKAGTDRNMLQENWLRVAAVVLMVFLWVGLSGVGGYVWQNEDHAYRNAMYLLLTEQKWPLIKEIMTESGPQGRGIVYYIGSWLPAAAAGKLLGTEAGWAVQYLWTAAGILLMYGQVCVYRKKIAVWPLVLIIFFSAPDVLGVLLGTTDTFQIFGETHLEWWPQYYQFSSVTTQLFWVYNQAVPAWLFSALLFLGEKPRNLVFLSSLMILTSTLPFLGILPYIIYFMIRRSVWCTEYRNVRSLWKDCLHNWGSVQNLLGGGVTAALSAVYLSGNHSMRESLQVLNDEHRMQIFFLGMVLAMAVFWAVATLVRKGWGRRLFRLVLAAGGAAIVWRIRNLPYEPWQSPVYYWINLTFFYAVEAGVFFCLLYPLVKDKKLFALNGIWLYVIPLVLIGHSNDFCMRASIPGLFLVMLWCIHAFDAWKRKKNNPTYRICLLAAVLALGAVTPLHEMKRSMVNTRNEYENAVAQEDWIFTGRNFSGSTKGFFWRYIAKQ